MDIDMDPIYHNLQYGGNGYISANSDQRYYLLKYFLEAQFGGKLKWRTFSHNGVLFPPEYEPHGIPIICEGQEVTLNPIAEEYATLYAKYLDTEYAKNGRFNRNFWKDWRKLLDKDTPIKSLDSCDFSLIQKHLLEKKEQRDLKKEKAERDEIEKPYLVAMVDEKEQKVGNFRIEPPGLFIGRGCNPLMGKIKRKVYPSDVVINIGKGEEIPKPMLYDKEAPDGDRYKWKKVIHDRSVEWLAAWKDNVTRKMKYVWLADHSDFKSKSDQKKFDLARRLKKMIGKIREENHNQLKSLDLKERQIATALYFIENLALRVGNEKGEDAADTVGVTSLRVEHIDLSDHNVIKLDFLGKDAIRYRQKVRVDEQVYRNLIEFTKGKTKDDQLFDQIASADINKYLQSFMDGLTAKVFRTYNASNLFQKELNKLSKKFGTVEDEDQRIKLMLDGYISANAKVAILCNHQKNVNKSNNKQIENINNQIKKTRTLLRKARASKRKNSDRIKKLKDRLEILKNKKKMKIDTKNVSLGTSKINYIDPRISVAFIKKHNLPIDKIFNKSLQEKFRWAFDCDENFKF